MEGIKQILKELCEADCIGGIGDALEVAKKHISSFAKIKSSGNSLVAEIKGKKDYTVMLDAHIDEIGMLVTNIDDNGFVSVAAAGGIDSRMLMAMKVNIHAKSIVKGVFCSVPPHLRQNEIGVLKLDELYIDTGLGKAAKHIISVGDRVTFEQSFAELGENYVTAKALDNRSGVAALIRCAQLLQNKELNCNVILLFSDMEEIGGSGVKTESFTLNSQCAVSVDVSFGNQQGVSNDECGILGKGAMIGISPILSKDITEQLKKAANLIGTNYQTEVMGGKTATNADHITVTKSGIPCGLLSIPLRNMHTPAEVVCIDDIESTALILAEFIKIKSEEIYERA